MQTKKKVRDYKYKCRTVFTGEDGIRHDVKARTFKELQAKVQKLQDNITHRRLSGSLITPESTVEKWIDYCLDQYKTNQSEITAKKYRRRVRTCITKYIGDLPIKSVRPINCQEVMNIQEGKSHTQINEVYQALKLIFKYAVINGLISKDPTLGLVKPSAAKRIGRRALTDKERETVLAVAKTDRRYYFYLLMLLCGCRPSEAAECQGRDIEYHEGYPLLHIRGTKTVRADRLVPIPDVLLDLIKNTPKFRYIAATRDGNKITNYDRLWRSFSRQLNLHMGCQTYRNQLVPPYPLAPDLVPYCFRHDYCTELAKAGVDVREAQVLMGHSDISTTINIYTNLSKADVALNLAKKSKKIKAAE